MDPVVDYRADHPAAHLTLNSPHNRNALSTALVTQLHEGLRRATEDPRVRMVVLGHTGGTFCAGADLSEASAGPPAVSTRSNSKRAGRSVPAIEPRCGTADSSARV